MNANSTVLTLITSGLPKPLVNQISNEYRSRIKEVDYCLNKYSIFSDLASNYKSVEIILALSIFHKRIIANLDGAVKFFKTVTTKSDAKIISIGDYQFDEQEKNKILSLLITYSQLLEKYNIPNNYVDYDATYDFLKKLKDINKFEND